MIRSFGIKDDRSRTVFEYNRFVSGANTIRCECKRRCRYELTQFGIALFWVREKGALFGLSSNEFLVLFF